MFFAYKVTKYSGALQEKTYRGKNPGKRERVWENVREKFGILLTNSDFDCIESTSVRKSKRKKAFPFAFRSLIRTFAAIILECHPMDEIQNDIAQELAMLQTLTGIDFSHKLEQICQRGEFHPVINETEIFSALSEQDDDYDALISAARRAVTHGYRVYILPNPKGIRTADFIFVRKGIYRLYDLKTIQGKASVLNRLMESIGQTNHVLLNMTTDYQATALARSIKKYFERNPSAVQVLIFRGNKVMSVTRKTLEDRNFVATFTKLYYK